MPERVLTHLRFLRYTRLVVLDSAFAPGAHGMMLIRKQAFQKDFVCARRFRLAEELLFEVVRTESSRQVLAARL